MVNHVSYSGNNMYQPLSLPLPTSLGLFSKPEGHLTNSKHTHCLSIPKNTQFIAVYCENHTNVMLSLTRPRSAYRGKRGITPLILNPSTASHPCRYPLTGRLGDPRGFTEQRTGVIRSTECRMLYYRQSRCDVPS